MKTFRRNTSENAVRASQTKPETMSYFDMPKTFELKAEYVVTRKFWPRTPQAWKAFWWNPWRYWRSHVLKEKIIKRGAEQIRKDIDDRIIMEKL
jgi:hypothetical protein